MQCTKVLTILDHDMLHSAIAYFYINSMLYGAVFSYLWIGWVSMLLQLHVTDYINIVSVNFFIRLGFPVQGARAQFWLRDF